MTNPQITGPNMLRAIVERTKGLPQGSVCAISLLDSYDLFKLEANDLTAPEFNFDSRVAERIVEDLRRGSLMELGKALGIHLIVDKQQFDSLVPNAGIIRSAGAFASDPQSLEETLIYLDQLRHGDRADR
jgi:hypothetical protein